MIMFYPINNATVNNSLPRTILYSISLCGILLSLLTRKRRIELQTSALLLLISLLLTTSLSSSFFVLGIFTVMLKALKIISQFCYDGGFRKGIRGVLKNKTLMLHGLYLVLSVMGLVVHPFFFAILVC